MSNDSAENGLLLSDDRTTVISFTPGADTESVEIPDSVTSLPEGLFSGCNNLREVKLPHNVRVLPARLFEDCTSLEKISMPTEIDSFGFGTFSGCSSLKSIPFRAGLTELPAEVFSCCTSLTSLIIPETVCIIRRGAVSGCTSLETVVLPSSLETLEKESFTGCTALRHIRISEDNKIYRVDESNGCLYETQDDGVELIVLTPVEYERFAAKLVKIDGENDTMAELQDECSDEIEKKAAEIVASDTIGTEDEIEPVSEQEIQLLSTESDILSQNTVVSGNPVVLTQKEVDAVHRDGKVVTTYDDDYFGPPVKRVERAVEESMEPEKNISAEEVLLGRIAAASEKYECITLSRSPDKPGWNGSLFAFAENLVFDDEGDGHFSDALISCCRRIARIHKYTHIYLYYGIPLDNTEFAEMFSIFISERSTLYACSSSTTTGLSESARRFITLTGISLEKDMLELENKLAGTEDANVLKMIVQDDYSA
jgi:hypothetical protein